MDWELWGMRREPFSFSLEQYCCGKMETTEGSFLGVGGGGQGVQDWDDYRLTLHQERRDSSLNDIPGQAEGNLFKTQPNIITWLSFYMYRLGILLPPEKQFSSEEP